MTPASIPPIEFLLTVRNGVVSCQRMGMKVTKKAKTEFAADLKAWRSRSGLSQSKAATALGVPVRSLQNWEIARTKPAALAERLLRNLFRQPAAKPARRRKKSA